MQFSLRDWALEDAASIAKYANNPKISANLRNIFPSPYTLSDAQQYIQCCQEASPTQKLFRAICVNNEAVGSIGVFLKDDVHCKTAELGYWLGEPFWCQGIMTRAIQQICEEAFSKYDIVRIFAEPFSTNTASQRVLEKSGFFLEGILSKNVYKNGDFFDSCMYALTR